MQLAISAILTAALLLGKHFCSCSVPARIRFLTLAYMNIYALGTIFVQLTLGMNAFITAQGFARVSMKTVLIGAICNIVLDPILIFGLGMGVKGAALATVISQNFLRMGSVTF